MTMTLISTTTVPTGGVASITFSSIPQTATELLITGSLRSTRAATNDVIWLKVNASTTGYYFANVYGDGSTVAAAGSSSSQAIIGNCAGATGTASTFGSTQIRIPNYTLTGNKLFLADTINEKAASYTGIYNNRWANSAAITSIEIYPQTGPLWAEFSTISLYTITKGSGGATPSSA